jgi:aryl-alcohol dehydrogenase-like predicted oxidoreductase
MIRKQPFGSTGHDSTVTLFGAAALGKVSQDDSDRTLDVLFEYGVNHIDTAASYGDSELRIGPWMKKHRDDFFLATKTGERTKADAREQIHSSLDRLQTDHLDMIQLHSLSHPDEWEVAMGDGGALEAAVEAREEGLVRFIGVTGHGWTIAAMHRRSLERFPFDAILLPCNYSMLSRKQYRKDFETVLRVCSERGVAVQTIKSIARGPWATTERDHNTWYQPFEEQDDIDRAVHYVMGIPEVFFNTVGDIGLLPKVLDAASRYSTRPSDEEMAEMVNEKRVTSVFGI